MLRVERVGAGRGEGVVCGSPLGAGD
eukprot:COSAG04_NODE_10574_length_767_cov_1.881737_1_plen_25_part_01